MEKPGDTVRVVTESGEFDGILMPQEREFLVIKLANGYNIGIDRKKIKDIKVVRKYEKRQARQAEPKHIPGKPSISVLHTGGTIASKVDYTTGGTSAKFTPEELVSMFPEVIEIANIKSRLVANIMSENMRFAHYNLLAREIEKEIREGCDGIIITHGTDSLHYTSAALSFILENLPVPVILVGSQRSSDRPSSDAAMNFLSAVAFIEGTDFAGVAICMHEGINDDYCHILPGAKARKMHTSRRDAFRPINSSIIARVNASQKKIEFMPGNYAKRNNAEQKGKNSSFRTLPFKEGIKVGLLRCYPNMFAGQFLAYLGYDGLVIELMGMGQGPIVSFDDITSENENIRKAIAELIKTGTVVAAAPQAIYGRLQMNVYSEGRKMQELGVIGNYSDMTPETSYLKLAWLLSNYSKEEALKHYTKNIAGEITERTDENTFLA